MHCRGEATKGAHHRRWRSGAAELGGAGARSCTALKLPEQQHARPWLPRTVNLPLTAPCHPLTSAARESASGRIGTSASSRDNVSCRGAGKSGNVQAEAGGSITQQSTAGAVGRHGTMQADHKRSCCPPYSAGTHSPLCRRTLAGGIPSSLQCRSCCRRRAAPPLVRTMTGQHPAQRGSLPARASDTVLRWLAAPQAAGAAAAGRAVAGAAGTAATTSCSVSDCAAAGMRRSGQNRVAGWGAQRRRRRRRRIHLPCRRKAQTRHVRWLRGPESGLPGTRAGK